MKIIRHNDCSELGDGIVTRTTVYEVSCNKLKFVMILDGNLDEKIIIFLGK